MRGTLTTTREVVGRFIDVTERDGEITVDKERMSKIDKFIGEPVGRMLLPECRKMYAVPWHTGGIPTDVSQQTPVCSILSG